MSHLRLIRGGKQDRPRNPNSLFDLPDLPYAYSLWSSPALESSGVLTWEKVRYALCPRPRLVWDRDRNGDS